MREEFSYNIILLGGTGAKCGEILLHMCANGYFKYRSLNILYIDSDLQNGNAEKFRNLYKTYEECRKRYLITSSPVSCFFCTKITLMEANPVGNFRQFSDMINTSEGNYESTESARALMECLYSKEEIELEISNGFFAHPNVGAAVFAANMDKIMSQFSALISTAMHEAKKVKIFLLGSIFGGTGAASLPTIVRYIKENMFAASNNKNIQKQMKIGGCMVLPYFMFSNEDKASQNINQEPSIEANKFAMKTKAALEYYKYVDEEENRKTFDELFILGHDMADIRGYYAAAGEKQRNLPHIVEFYAAMSAITFFEDEMGKRGHYFAVVPKDKIGGENIYGAERGYSFFFVMMRFAIVMKSLIIEELFDYTQKNKIKGKAKRIPWYYDFLNGKGKARNFEADRLYSYFEDIERYCDEYIRWFAELNLGNISKLKVLHEINYDEEKKETVQKNEGDTVEYLSFFDKKILFKQYQNNQIRNQDVDLDDETAENLYKQNLEYIRDNMEKLEKIHFNTDMKSEKVTMSQIWSRLSNMGFNSFIKDDDVFQNIVNSTDKSMGAGVRNLINAVFCACLF